MRLAVVGAGVAGVVAAHRLQERYQVDLIEADTRLGGHTHTFQVPDGPAVDTGFIVFNRNTYPLFERFLDELKVRWQLSDMSFGYYCQSSGWAYGGHDLNTFFARRRFLFHPDFVRFGLEVMRFNQRSLRLLANDAIQGSLSDYLRGYTRSFVRHYILPLGSAIWSAPLEAILEFPAATFVRFFAQHGLLRVVNRPDWYTVQGGAVRYLEAFERRFQGRILRATPVRAVRRFPDRVELDYAGESHSYDYVVLATHADQALQLLADPTPEERRALAPWRYRSNLAVLHSDPSVLPPLSRVRASWNYLRPSQPQELPTLTYDMNRLQGLAPDTPYLVTLNPQQGLRHVHGRWHYRHPQFDQQALASQPGLADLQGRNRSAFCGSYHRYGFHEDAVWSAGQAAAALGARG